MDFEDYAREKVLKWLKVKKVTKGSHLVSLQSALAAFNDWTDLPTTQKMFSKIMSELFVRHRTTTGVHFFLNKHV